MSSISANDKLLQFVTLLGTNRKQDEERKALVKIDPVGFLYRAPPKQHELKMEQTADEELFQTIHMGAAVVDRSKWKLVVDGLLERPFCIDWNQLLKLPRESITAFHECYGSPIKPPVENLWRIGNVKWTGVPLHTLLKLGRPTSDAKFVWSDGLEHGSFQQVKADRYQKDLPLKKALSSGVLVAYLMNDKPLTKERGGPVRLIVPGWYGTNSTKWLCRLTLQSRRSPSPFTTTFYNEIDPTDVQKQRRRPIWDVEPNSFLLTAPASHAKVKGPEVKIAGKAWGANEIKVVTIYVKNNDKWEECKRVKARPRKDFEWQLFEALVQMKPGKHEILARATDSAGQTQPISGRRNHAHKIEIQVV